MPGKDVQSKPRGMAEEVVTRTLNKQGTHLHPLLGVECHEDEGHQRKQGPLGHGGVEPRLLLGPSPEEDEEVGEWRRRKKLVNEGGG